MAADTPSAIHSTDRINAINDFVEAGYEVRVNFSPVIVYEGWRADYEELFSTLDDALSEEAKAQARVRGHLPHP